jgi:hypothetical protein
MIPHNALMYGHIAHVWICAYVYTPISPYVCSADRVEEDYGSGRARTYAAYSTITYLPITLFRYYVFTYIAKAHTP